MYLFGGSNLERENQLFFALDMNTKRWDVVKARGEEVASRDEHVAIIYDQSMIIFGGFEKGERTNTLLKFVFKEKKWKKYKITEGLQPEPRSGHAGVLHNDVLYIFGGKDVENSKLNDLWALDLVTNKWECLNDNCAENAPVSRSGHSLNVYKDNYLVLFGGIHEITKELNDLYFYDLRKKEWVQFMESDSLKADNKRTLNIDGSIKDPDKSPTIRNDGTPIGRNQGVSDFTPPKSAYSSEIKMKKKDRERIRKTLLS